MLPSKVWCHIALPADTSVAASGAPGKGTPVGEERWAKRHQWKIVGGAVLAVGAVAVGASAGETVGSAA